MVVLLIRHGENEYTRTGKLAGWTKGVSLNEPGRKQAEGLVARLKRAPIKHIYSSPLERARETAAPLAAARGLSVELRPGLGEVQYGQWTGKSLKVLGRTKLWKVVQQLPSAMRFPDGESMRGAQMRMVDAIDEIARAHASPKSMVAIFTHSDPIKLAVAHYLGLPLDLFQRLMVSTASVTALRLGQGQPSLIKLNDTGE
jgi:probable phosphomutase (TIGR03848 family)